MSVDHMPFVPRGPRHETTGCFQFRIEIERAGEFHQIAGELMDLSRNGFKARTDVPLELGESVRVYFPLEQIGFQQKLTANVRWTDVDGLVSGFLLDEPAPLEVLGELILLGVVEGKLPADV